MRYWTDRFQDEYDAIFDMTFTGISRQMRKQYDRAAKDIIRDMESLYLKIQADAQAGKIRNNDLYRYNRLYKLLGEINKKLKALGQKQIKTLKPGMEELYKNNAEFIRNSFGFETIPNEQAAEDVLNWIWHSDGKHWSDRIWNDKQKLTEALTRGLFDCVAKGASHTELTKTLMDSFNVSYRRAETLARTELSYIQTQSTLQQYKAEGVTQYIIIDAGDYPGSGKHPERECTACHEKAEKGPYEIAKAIPGENLPPMHPNCRCCIAPYNADIQGYYASMTEAERKAERKRLNEEALKNIDNSDDEDYNLYRKTNEIFISKGYTEPPKKNHIKTIMAEMGIDYGHAKININRASEYFNTGTFGRTSKDGREVTFYPDAFKSRETLVKTIGHESIHLNQIKIFGPAEDTATAVKYEAEAFLSEDKWWQEYKKKIK